MPFLGVEVIFVSNPAACVCYPALPRWCEGMILGYFWVGFVLPPPASGDADTGAVMLVLVQGQRCCYRGSYTGNAGVGFWYWSIDTGTGAVMLVLVLVR